MIAGDGRATRNHPIASAMITASEVSPGEASPACRNSCQNNDPLDIQLHLISSLLFPAIRLVTHTPLNECVSIQAVHRTLALL
jgi:hypothetical protein